MSAASVSAAKIIYDSSMYFFFLKCPICFGWWWRSCLSSW